MNGLGFGFTGQLCDRDTRSHVAAAAAVLPTVAMVVVEGVVEGVGVSASESASTSSKF